MHLVTLIKRQKISGLATHYGVLLPDNRVIDIHENWEIVTMDQFSHNGKYPVTKEVTRTVDDKELKSRLQRLFATFDFHGFFRNCEHWSRLIVEGKFESKQTNSLAAILGSLIILWVGSID